MIIIMCDGSSLGNPGECKIGIVIWDRINTQKTSPKHKISESIGQGTNNDAEWQAVIRGLEIAKTMNDKIIFIYSDSQLVVNQATGKFKVKLENMKIYKQMYDELCQGLDVTINWIPRQLTVLADKLT